MKISIVQFTPEFGEVEKNQARIEEYAKKTQTDFLIFPELSTSGYFFQSKEETALYAEETGGPFYEKLASIAVETGKIICYGFPEKSGDKFYNTCALLFPERRYNRAYRKTHLFYKERFCFDEGDTGFFVVDYKEKDIKIGVMICYDWRFPEASRTLALLGSDLIICPSNLVTNAWHMVMPARAIENKVYFAVANRAGAEEKAGEEVSFKGLSAIYSYNGQTMAKAGPDTEEIIEAEIFPEKTRDKSFNEFNDVFKDRKPEFYIK